MSAINIAIKENNKSQNISDFSATASVAWGGGTFTEYSFKIQVIIFSSCAVIMQVTSSRALTTAWPHEWCGDHHTTGCPLVVFARSLHRNYSGNTRLISYHH